MRRTAETNDRIAWELNEERVSALRRISQTLDGLLAQLRLAGERVQATEGDQRLEAVDAYRDIRRRAVQYRWYLEVQREAMGLRHHHRLDEFYPIPADLT